MSLFAIDHPALGCLEVDRSLHRSRPLVASDGTRAYGVALRDTPVDAGVTSRLSTCRSPALARWHGEVDTPWGTAAVTDWVGDCTLQDLLDADRVITPGQLALLLARGCDALTALVDAGLAHGSLTPRQIAIDPDGRPTIVGVERCVVPEDPTGGECDAMALSRIAGSVAARTPEPLEPVLAETIATLGAGAWPGLAQRRALEAHAGRSRFLGRVRGPEAVEPEPATAPIDDTAPGGPDAEAPVTSVPATTRRLALAAAAALIAVGLLSVAEDATGAAEPAPRVTADAVAQQSRRTRSS